MAICRTYFRTLLIFTAHMAAQTMTTLHGFTGAASDGSEPHASLVIGDGGVMFGTTYWGGPSNDGSVYSLAPPTSKGGPWTETVLHCFSGSDGANPIGGVVIGTGGVLYGTTAYGGAMGNGTVYSLTPPAAPGGTWMETTLHSFSGGRDGGNSIAGVVIDGDGVLYGATFLGGDGGAGCTGNQGCGVVFLLRPPESQGDPWGEEVLHSFAGPSDGANPMAPLVLGKGKVLFGTTYYGGTSGGGTVFTLTATKASGWSEAVLHSFTGTSGGDGDQPSAGVVIGKDGVLYGTTYGGGVSNTGTVFSLAPPASPGGPWIETVLHSFSGAGDGSLPNAGVAIGHAGVLYGVTESGGTANFGTIYRLSPPASPSDPWTESILHDFAGSDGALPAAGVVFGNSGVVYGTTETGGTSYIGNVFSLKP
jgi:uncharacterized repeat protein (TIGR03803 family)